MTLTDPWPGFQGHGSFKRRISRKRCILHTKLLQNGNRKPYTGYQLVSLSMTLSDPWPGFQGRGSFKRGVSPKRRILQTQLLYDVIGHHRHAIDRQASYTAYNPTASVTRGNYYKLVPQHCKYDLRKHYFTNRVVPVWNSLPNIISSFGPVSLLGAFVNSTWVIWDWRSRS